MCVCVVWQLWQRCVSMYAVNQCGVICQPLAMVCLMVITSRHRAASHRLQTGVGSCFTTLSHVEKIQKFLIGPLTCQLNSEIMYNRLCVTHAVTKTVEAVI